jgi:hypothetical protein
MRGRPHDPSWRASRPLNGLPVCRGPGGRARARPPGPSVTTGGLGRQDAGPWVASAATRSRKSLSPAASPVQPSHGRSAQRATMTPPVPRHGPPVTPTTLLPEPDVTHRVGRPPLTRPARPRLAHRPHQPLPPRLSPVAPTPCPSNLRFQSPRRRPRSRWHVWHDSSPRPIAPRLQPRPGAPGHVSAPDCSSPRCQPHRSQHHLSPPNAPRPNVLAFSRGAPGCNALLNETARSAR